MNNFFFINLFTKPHVMSSALALKDFMFIEIFWQGLLLYKMAHHFIHLNK